MLSLQGDESEWAPFLNALPKSVQSPLFWAAEQQEELLRGSPVLKEAKARAAALQKEWSAIQEKISAEPGTFEPGTIKCLQRCCLDLRLPCSRLPPERMTSRKALDAIA